MNEVDEPHQKGYDKRGETINPAFKKHWTKDGTIPFGECGLRASLEAFKAGQEDIELRVSKALGGMPESELWSDNGLIAATMRIVDAYEASLEEKPKQ